MDFTCASMKCLPLSACALATLSVVTSTASALLRQGTANEPVTVPVASPSGTRHHFNRQLQIDPADVPQRIWLTSRTRDEDDRHRVRDRCGRGRRWIACFKAPSVVAVAGRSSERRAGTVVANRLQKSTAVIEECNGRGGRRCRHQANVNKRQPGGGDAASRLFGQRGDGG